MLKKDRKEQQKPVHLKPGEAAVFTPQADGSYKPSKIRVTKPAPQAPGLAIYQKSGDPVSDIESQVSRTEQDIKRLQFQLSTLPTKESLQAALEAKKAELQEQKKKIEALKLEDAQYLRSLTESKRKTAFHGDLIDSITRDPQGELVYHCRKHPNRSIAFWDIHVSTFALHSEIKENSPIFRRQQREKLERERNAQREEAEKRALEAERNRRNYLEREGFVVS
ncbi:MAG: hypothetical protein ACYCQJ_05215 [Nitrososphaerales archaeon]